MKKLILILFLVALAAPMFGRVLPGLSLATAYADDQGENDDCQGDEDGDICF